jgi:hypothetical protein
MYTRFIKIGLVVTFIMLSSGFDSLAVAQVPSSNATPVIVQPQTKDWLDYTLALIQLFTLVGLIVYVFKTWQIAASTRDSTEVSRKVLVEMRESERRRVKLDTLRRYVANRMDVRHEEFLRVLNEILVTFQDSAEVKQALSEYHRKVNTADAEEGLLSLFKAMCKDLNINLESYDDSFFLNPFNTRRTLE